MAAPHTSHASAGMDNLCALLNSICHYSSCCKCWDVRAIELIPLDLLLRQEFKSPKSRKSSGSKNSSEARWGVEGSATVGKGCCQYPKISL